MLSDAGSTPAASTIRLALRRALARDEALAHGRFAARHVFVIALCLTRLRFSGQPFEGSLPLPACCQTRCPFSMHRAAGWLLQSLPGSGACIAAPSSNPGAQRILVPSEFLNRSGWGTSHREMRTERVTQDVNPWLHVRSSGGITQPGFWKVDTALARVLRLDNTRTLELRVEAFNLFNNFNRAIPTTSINSPTFGEITTQNGDSRIMQFAIKYASEELRA